MTHGLILRLNEQRPYASPAERNIIAYVQANPQAVLSLSIRELASATYTSPSTITRFCKKLGCSGFKEFQRELVFEFASSQERGDMALEVIDANDSADEIVAKVVKSDLRSIEATGRLIDAATLERCAQLILQSRVVGIFGIGASLLVAHDLEMKLTRIDKMCVVNDDWHNQRLFAKNMHPNDLAIVISYSGFTEEMIECARYARQQGARVIAITRIGNDAGLARQADYVLGIAADEPLIRSGAMGSRMSQMVMIDALYAVCVAKDFERCSALIRRNYTVKEDPEGRRKASKERKGGSDARSDKADH